ncbi:MAG TPA: ABC transporter ATP-binding protein [Spirochaetota bacterium]|nr:ABC transporter ATP-binding protein [Spirochaetota bacterium]HPJ44016.1 ABC transporter ATP-binding protein [Spirochaetota bacterium]
MHKNYSIHVNKISKRFGKQLLFRDISFSAETGGSYFITGPNGSGKSTMLQIIAGVQKSTAGEILFSGEEKEIPAEERFSHFGFTSPAVNPYDMLTAAENIRFASSGVKDERIDEMLNLFGLYPHRSKHAGLYSSGMKQRLKLIIAMIDSPGILLLDEPSNNLDSAGKDILFSEIEKIRNKTLIIIATNEHDEIKLCTKGLDIAEQNI